MYTKRWDPLDPHKFCMCKTHTVETWRNKSKIYEYTCIQKDQTHTGFECKNKKWKNTWIQKDETHTCDRSPRPLTSHYSAFLCAKRWGTGISFQSFLGRTEMQGGRDTQNAKSNWFTSKKNLLYNRNENVLFFHASFCSRVQRLGELKWADTWIWIYWFTHI